MRVLKNNINFHLLNEDERFVLLNTAYHLRQISLFKDAMKI